MKKLHFFLGFCSIVLISCVNESVELENGSTSTNIYMPLAVGNYWTYKVVGAVTIARDSLYVQKDTVVNGNISKKMKTKFNPFGFYSNSLNNNTIRQVADKLLVSGKSNFDFIANLGINVGLTDFVAFKEVTTNNEQVGLVDGEISQIVQGLNLKVTYNLRSIGLTPLNSFTTSMGKTYADVKPMKYILTLKVVSPTVIAGIPFDVTILNTQEVVVSTQYFAKNKGMVFSKTVVNYQLQTLPPGAPTLPIPQSGTNTQEEFLDTFLAN